MTTRITIDPAQLDALKTRVQAYLDTHALTPAQLSDQCWLSHGVVSRILRGVSVPSNTTIKHLARGMSIAEDELLAPLPQPENVNGFPTYVTLSTPYGDRLWNDAIQQELHGENDADEDVDETEESEQDTCDYGCCGPQDGVEDVSLPANPFFDATNTVWAQYNTPPQQGAVSYPYRDDDEPDECHPYILVTKDTIEYQNGMNLSHVTTWRDDKAKRLLELLFTDGQRMVIGTEQRDIVLAHLRRMNRNLAIV